MKRAKHEKMRRIRLKLTNKKQTDLKFVGDRTTNFPNAASVNVLIDRIIMCCEVIFIGKNLRFQCYYLSGLSQKLIMKR